VPTLNDDLSAPVSVPCWSPPPGLSAKQGAWLYGDYINNVDGVTTAIACAQACVADTKCFSAKRA